MSQANESDVARSPLLRLPAEIRHRIFRMVIGGRTIHLAKVFSRGGDGLSFSKCQCSLCIAENTGYCVQRSLAGFAFSCVRVNHKCVPPMKASGADAERIDFGLSKTNRQIHDECFHIFWRTTRFYFGDPEVMDIFLKCINEGQKQNVRHLVICCLCNSTLTPAPKKLLWNWASFRSDGKGKVKGDWRSNKTTTKGFYFPHLATIELHLQLQGFSRENGLSHEARVLAFRAAFGPFEVLRLLHLKDAFVTLSYAEDYGRRDYEKLITEKEGAEIANTLRDRLLDSVLTEETLRRPLVDDIQCEIERLEGLSFDWTTKPARLRNELLDLLHADDLSEVMTILEQIKAARLELSWHS